MSNFKQIGEEIGELVQKKNLAYGNSFGKSGEIIEILYPDGIEPNQYQDMLTIIRVLDKLFRIATDKDALGENPWNDICGYAILAIAQGKKDK